MIPDTPETRDRIKAMLQSGQTYAAVAKMLGVRYNHLLEFCHSHGIAKRSRHRLTVEVSKDTAQCFRNEAQKRRLSSERLLRVLLDILCEEPNLFDNILMDVDFSNKKYAANSVEMEASS